MSVSRQLLLCFQCACVSGSSQELVVGQERCGHMFGSSACRKVCAHLHSVKLSLTVSFFCRHHLTRNANTRNQTPKTHLIGFLCEHTTAGRVLNIALVSWHSVALGLDVEDSRQRSYGMDLTSHI